MKFLNKNLMIKTVTFLLFLSMLFTPLFPSFASEENQNFPAGVGHVFFTGYEYDGDTGLNYAGSRYYEARIGRFISQDPVYLATGDRNAIKSKTGQSLESYLSDPQGFNSYSYARNNPLRIIDPNGEWFKEMVTGQQSWSSFTQEVGQATQYMGSGWQTMMDHPYLAGGAIGVGGGLAAAGGAAVATKLSVAYLQGAGTACLVGCWQAGQVGLSEYNAAVNWISSRGANPSNLPSRSEVQNVMGNWVNTNMPDKTSSILYHYNKHADGNTLNALTKNGLNVWNNYTNDSSLVKSVGNSILRNGETGIKVNLTFGAGGIFTKAGGIITTWFK
jgi:RHS repeat-associated protein